jgi:hypothetical protein
MNTSFIHADIFFFVTTIAVVLVSIVLVIVLIYLAKILSDIKEITREVKEETVLIRGDIQGLRENVKHEGFRLGHLWTFFRTLIKRPASTRSKKIKS